MSVKFVRKSQKKKLQNDKRTVYKKVVRQTRLYRKKNKEYWRDLKMKAQIYEEENDRINEEKRENIRKGAKRKRKTKRKRDKKNVESKISEEIIGKGEEEGKEVVDNIPDQGNARSVWAGLVQNAEVRVYPER